MRVLYVAKHNKGHNDNEGAIRHALEKMGHTVTFVEESAMSRNWQTEHKSHNADLMLFQNWRNPPDVSDFDGPRVMWYFDRVTGGIPATHASHRTAWMRLMLPRTTHAFCTDGDWALDNGMTHLMQGADERRCRPPSTTEQEFDVLFVGGASGLTPERRRFVTDLRDRYGARFQHVSNRYGQRLRNLVETARIVIAPPTPVTDLYYSNRVYVMLSMGAMLLHPYSKTVAEHYTDGEEIILYHGQEDMHDKIAKYLHRDNSDIRHAAYERTLREHTYRHRLETIIQCLP